ncbi:cation:proton antiporter [Halomicroarcula sp. GCM10025710]
MTNFLIVSLGGILVGVGIGYATYRTQRVVNDKTNLFMISVVGVYGGFYLAEHVLHVSGILATVITGIVLGIFSRQYALSEENLEFLGRSGRRSSSCLKRCCSSPSASRSRQSRCSGPFRSC